MIRRPPRSTRTDTLVPYTTLFRSHLGETVGLEGRLLAPMIGNKRASWDKALDLVAKRFKETIARHGPGSVAFYVSGQLLTEDYYVANKLMTGYIGTAHIDTNSRLSLISDERREGKECVRTCRIR